jgi:hypothetical protein
MDIYLLIHFTLYSPFFQITESIKSKNSEYTTLAACINQ